LYEVEREEREKSEEEIIGILKAIYNKIALGIERA